MRSWRWAYPELRRLSQRKTVQARLVARARMVLGEDLSRSGPPVRLGTREQAVVLGLAYQGPEDLGRLEGRMTQPIIAEEAAKQGVTLSRSSVQRILSLPEVKPRRERREELGFTVPSVGVPTLQWGPARTPGRTDPGLAKVVRAEIASMGPGANAGKKQRREARTPDT